ncbi:MAG: GxxExxY protein [Chitinophagaceae bacterium]
MERRFFYDCYDFFRMEENFKHTELSNKIIKAFYIVCNRLGYGFLEKVYKSALLIELNKIGLKAER